MGDPKPTVPDPEMTIYELDTLRVMNGEHVPGWIGGAAANVCCAWLKARGYAEGLYSISQRGRDYLAALSSEVPPIGSEQRDEGNLPPAEPLDHLSGEGSRESGE